MTGLSSKENGAEASAAEASFSFGAASLLDSKSPQPYNDPSPLQGPLVWSGVDFEDCGTYSCQLSHGDVHEIESALEVFKTLGLDGDKVTRHNFPLPSLEPRLLGCAIAVHTGRGFFVLKGLDATRYSVEDNITIFLGIAEYIADQRGIQDRKGNILSHIIDSKLWTVPRERRHGIHSPSALPYHTDMGCDILALQVRQDAGLGGATYLSSTWTAFNQLLEKDISAVQELLSPTWPVQISGRDARHYLAPALTIYQGKLMASLDPGRFGPHPASEPTDIPNLTTAQSAALNKMLDSARQNELCLRLNRGDMLFLNNWSLLHRRDSYVDREDTSRHMIRLWLRNTELGWAVPDCLMLPWLCAYGREARARDALYSLAPMPEYKAPRYSAGSAAFVIEDLDSTE